MRQLPAFLQRSERDLTQCSIPIGILGLAAPTIAGAIFHALQSLVDLYFVGDLGESAVAAVGMGGTVIMLLVTIFVGLNTATVALISRAYGAGDYDRANETAGQVLLLTVVFSAVISVIGYLYAARFLQILNAEAPVVELGAPYLQVMFGGIFFLCAAFVLNGVLQGAGDATTPLLLGILTTVANIILTPLLIFGYGTVPGLGVPGSALATVSSRALSLAVGLAVLLGPRLRVRLHLCNLIPNPALIRSIVLIALPNSVQMGLRMFMNLVLMALVATFGTAAVAGYTIGIRIRMTGLFPSFGFGAAVATMVGQNLGAERPGRSARSITVGTAMGFFVTAAAGACFYVYASGIIAFFDEDAAVVDAGSTFLRVTMWGLLSAPIGIVLARALNGAGDTTSPLVITLVALWGFQVPAAIYLAGIRELWGIAIPFTDRLPNWAPADETGIWYAMVAASVLQAILSIVWVATGRWKKIEV
jgi:putative MATE family efflux protein